MKANLVAPATSLAASFWFLSISFYSFCVQPRRECINE